MINYNKDKERVIKMAKKLNPKEDKQDMALIGTFIALVILVSALGLYAMNLEKIKMSNSIADITIPVLESNSESELSVEVSDMEEGDTKEYILAVSNYKDKLIIEKAINYDVDITPTENTSIKVYKNDSSDNLLTEDDLLIENNKLSPDKKKEDTYRIVIEAKQTPEEDERITIKINS